MLTLQSYVKESLQFTKKIFHENLYGIPLIRSWTNQWGSFWKVGGSGPGYRIHRYPALADAGADNHYIGI